jgi:hypothetical protein
MMQVFRKTQDGSIIWRFTFQKVGIPPGRKIDAFRIVFFGKQASDEGPFQIAGGNGRCLRGFTLLQRNGRLVMTTEKHISITTT